MLYVVVTVKVKVNQFRKMKSNTQIHLYLEFEWKDTCCKDSLNGNK